MSRLRRVRLLLPSAEEPGAPEKLTTKLKRVRQADRIHQRARLDAIDRETKFFVKRHNCCMQSGVAI